MCVFIDNVLEIHAVHLALLISFLDGGAALFYRLVSRREYSRTIVQGRFQLLPDSVDILGCSVVDGQLGFIHISSVIMHLWLAGNQAHNPGRDSRQEG